MAYAADLKSVAERYKGSNPFTRIMIYLFYVICGVPLVLLCLMPWFIKVGERRFQRDKLKLQALAGQVISELRASYDHTD